MAVSGVPGRGSVHVVESVPALGRDSVTVVNGVAVRGRGGHNTAVVPVAGGPPPVVHPAVAQPPLVQVQPQPVAALPVPVAPTQAAPRKMVMILYELSVIGNTWFTIHRLNKSGKVNKTLQQMMVLVIS